ncbi:MAG: prepilin-type N-terminal cleavage/methylation domain-containing protein, partial [Planctomycetaceae bacterium]|nr:prepilin-type N-terminal cleavage/methylation domain-containing protein [Planctomycetaceae bacterium]
MADGGSLAAIVDFVFRKEGSVKKFALKSAVTNSRRGFTLIELLVVIAI